MGTIPVSRYKCQLISGRYKCPFKAQKTGRYDLTGGVTIGNQIVVQS